VKRVLVVHALSHLQRRTTIEFVSAFGRYAPDHVDVEHVNIRRPLTTTILGRRFDAVLLTYDLLALRSSTQWEWAMEKMAALCALGDRVIAFPQDDYTYHALLDESLEALSTDIIYTPIETGLHLVYPTMHRKAVIRHAHTGYVDEEAVYARRPRLIPLADRTIHVCQRVRMLPPWFGRAGREKGLFANRFAEIASERTGLVVDISTRDEDVLAGEDWYAFLGSSRATIGQRGGASLCDPDGAIMRTVIEFQEAHPGATFEEIEAACFLGLDSQAEMKAISPRLFDAAMLGTAQILIEDDYLGEFEPWVHYIPTDADVSNIDEIAVALDDTTLLEKLTTAASDALIFSGRYTYRAFVESVFADSVPTADHPSAVRPDVDAADEIQWRLSPDLFEGVQRVAHLAWMTQATETIATLVEDIATLLTDAPELIDHLDHRLLTALFGHSHLGRGIDAVGDPLVELMVEVFRAGAAQQVAQWLRAADSDRFVEWELLTWMDQDRVLLDDGLVR